jgi:hypothetical protein
MYYFHRAVDGGFWRNFGHASGGTLGDRQPKQFGTFLTQNRPHRPVIRSPRRHGRAALLVR